MSARGARLPFRIRLTLILLGPLLVWGAARLLDRAPADARLAADTAAARLQRAFAGLLDEAREAALTAIEDAPGTRLPERWAERLEGYAVLGPDGRFEEWEGTPAAPPDGFPPPDTPAWSLRVDGVRTRLFVAPGPDPDGRPTVASFIIDTTLADLPFRDLLPKDAANLVSRFQLLDSEALAAGAFVALPLGAVLLRSPDDAAFARAALVRHRPGSARAPTGRRAALLALVGFVALCAFLIDWRSIASTWAGASVAIATIAATRVLLVLTAAPAALLSTEWGGPSVYGSLRPWGLLASPVDLLLTATAVGAVCLAIRVTCSASAGRGSRRAAFGVAAVTALGASVTALALSMSIARDSGLPPADRPLPFVTDPRVLLWLGLLIVCLGAAELWALSVSLARPNWRPRRRGAGPLPVALAAIPLIAAAVFTMQHVADAIAVERVVTEFAPRLLEQDSRRLIAIRAALREIRDRFEETGRFGGNPAHGRSAAYRYWVTGELFHSRYRSSLAILDTEGNTIDEFSFGVASFDEEPTRPVIEGRLPDIRYDYLDESLDRQNLLHGEIALRRGEETVGVAVAHIINEPTNVPFLPGNRRFLAALGPVFTNPSDGSLTDRLEYVLYDEFGSVSLTTLRTPPAQTAQLLRAVTTGEPVTLRAGSETYRALPLEQEERMHLLLLPVRTSGERLAGAARALLLGLALLAAFAVTSRLSRPGGLREVADLLLGSFYARIMAAFLLASIPPLIVLAFFVGGYIDRRADAALADSAARIVDSARRVIEDYADLSHDVPIEDGVLQWLSGVVGQEIHTYENGMLEATSMRELFSAGFLPPTLDGTVQRRLIREGLPSVVISSHLGRGTIPVAYARARGGVQPGRARVVAVPLVLEQQERLRAVARVSEMILLATMALIGLLALAAAAIARTVATPVRDLVDATERIAAGDYATRLEPRTRDEVAELVGGFNSMAAALGRQRDDLERRRDYIETLLRHATTGVVSLDPGGRVVTMNPAATALLATCSDRLSPGAPLGEALAGCPHLAPLSGALERAGRHPGEAVDVDLADDGEARRYRLVRVRLERADGGSYGTLVLLDDVTELMRTNQLAAWAEMARAIAHEIKNPLTPIQLSTEHLRRLLHDRGVLPSAEEDACIETVIKQVRALQDIAGEFSAYAKLPDLQLEPVDPTEFMRATVEPYRSAPPQHISIRESYDDAPPVAVDAKVLSRAVINFIENALHAMVDGGSLEAGVRYTPGAEFVELFVTDTGPGLAPEVRRRLFEPYFSTKSSGTGLGLAIAQRAVEDHRGKIEVDSEPQRGTTFRILLPPAGTTA